jgi:hypothetical protein
MRQTRHECEKETKLAAFRLPEYLRQQARAKAQQEDITFSQLMRRAIRRELGVSDGKEKEAA